MVHELDYRHPDYGPIREERGERLLRLRQMTPPDIGRLKEYYANHVAEFIGDWGMTFDPRNVDVGLPAWVPFVLFQKQLDWIEWFLDRWQSRENGLTEKTRDMGVSWLAVSVAATICMFRPGVVAGFGSRKEDYVDKIGDPKSLFWKAREFIARVPAELRCGWDRNKHAPHMRIMFPETRSVMTGEAGDNIGRGDRSSFYIIDESAHLERPALIDASLSATTNCRIDLSSTNGMDNPFAKKRFSGKVKVFTFHWRDDPRKNQAWYDDQVERLDPVTLAQEIDINYSASVERIVIPGAWVQAAVDAHKKLGIEPTGARTGALDVADEGKDLNAFCGAHGIVIEHIEEWSGKTSDIFGTVQYTFLLCDMHGYESFRFDSDGLGAGVRGDARIINDQRKPEKPIGVEPFRGSEAPMNPEREDVKGRKNKDYFANRKAQAWWSLRTRFQKTYRAVVEGKPYHPDDIISLSSEAKEVQKLIIELSQPTYEINTAGKILINKAPDGMESPNLADAVMIRFAPSTGISTWAKLGR